MNIVFLAKEYPPYGLNFASALFYPRLAQALVERGHRVHVISQAPDGRETFQEDHGVTVHRVGPSPRSGSALRRGLYSFNAWRRLTRLAKSERIDLVEASAFFGEGFFCSLWKPAPLVVQSFAFSDMFLTTGSYGGFAEMVSLRISALLEDVSLRRADKIIANSPATYRYVVERKGISKGRVALIWESRIDLDKYRFTPSDIRTSLGISTEALLVLYVGWLQARKGLHILAQALPQILAHVPSAVFVFLGRDTLTAPGGGSFKRFLLNCALGSGISTNVKIIEDFLPEQDLVRLYSACDVFVLPSLSETFGWPVVEAMACSRPVVATATGIAPEMEGASPVFRVVPPGDAEALADAIISVLAVPKEDRERLAASHRRVVEECFSFERMVEQLLKVYQQVIAEAKAKRR